MPPNRPRLSMEDLDRPVGGDGANRQPFSCPDCDRTVGHVEVLTGDFSFEDVTPITGDAEGNPSFRETGLEDGPQKAIDLRCDFCGQEFTLGVETGE